MGNWGSSTATPTVPVTVLPTFAPTEAATIIASGEGHHHTHPTFSPTEPTQADSLAMGNDHSMGSLFMLLVVAGVMFYCIYQHMQKKQATKAVPTVNFELPGLRIGSKQGYEPIADEPQAGQV